jgi:hypothetical protein
VVFNQVVRVYQQSDFAQLPAFPPQGATLALLRTRAGELALTVPVIDVRMSPSNNAVVFEFDGVPSNDDFSALDAFVAVFQQTATTSLHQEALSSEAATTQSTSFQTKIDETTASLTAGTYMVNWQSTLRMSVAGASSGVLGRMRVERSDGQFLEQTSSWDLTVGHAFNGCVSFPVAEGQTLRATLSYARIGANGTAEMNGARVAMDRVGF